jgi:hypothetical protein
MVGCAVDLAPDLAHLHLLKQPLANDVYNTLLATGAHVLYEERRLTVIQSPTNALGPAVETVREISVVSEFRVQMPPDVDHLPLSVLLGLENFLECPCLGLRVPWRLVPVGLWIGEVKRCRRHVDITCPDHGLLCVQRVKVCVEVLIPGVLFG